eukprot:scaffold82109_cov26-Tisochrysis_lutea.AAC.2
MMRPRVWRLPRGLMGCDCRQGRRPLYCGATRTLPRVRHPARAHRRDFGSGHPKMRRQLLTRRPPSVGCQRSPLAPPDVPLARADGSAWASRAAVRSGGGGGGGGRFCERSGPAAGAGTRGAGLPALAALPELKADKRLPPDSSRINADLEARLRSSSGFSGRSPLSSFAADGAPPPTESSAAAARMLGEFGDAGGCECEMGGGHRDGESARFTGAKAPPEPRERGECGGRGGHRRSEAQARGGLPIEDPPSRSILPADQREVPQSTEAALPTPPATVRQERQASARSTGRTSRRACQPSAAAMALAARPQNALRALGQTSPSTVPPAHVETHRSTVRRPRHKSCEVPRRGGAEPSVAASADSEGTAIAASPVGGVPVATAITTGVSPEHA